MSNTNQSSNLVKTPGHFRGPSAPLPRDNLFTFCFSTPFQHSPNDFIPPSVGRPTPEHTFAGQVISPKRPCLVHAEIGAVLTWEQARADILRIARSLDSLLINSRVSWDGKDTDEPIISPERTILLHLPNSFVFPLILLAGAASLCTMSPISTLLTPEELANILAKARPQLLVTTTTVDGEEKLQKALKILLERPDQDIGSITGKEVKNWAKELMSSWNDATPTKQRVWTVDVNSRGGADHYATKGKSHPADARDWSNLLGTAGKEEAFVVRKLTEMEQRRRVMLLLWSSGTTGTSKGVLLSHRNLVASMVGNWVSCPHIFGPSQGPHPGGETWIALAPWCHIYGLTTLLLPAFTLGATLILPASSKFDLATYLGLVSKYRATTMHIAPPVAVMLRSTPLLDRTSPQGRDIDLSSVRNLLSGGAPTPSEVIKAIYKRTGKVLQIGYGATEAGSNAHCVAQDLTTLNQDSLDELGSVGAPMGNLEISIRPIQGTTEEQALVKHKELIEQGELKRLAGECAPIEPGLPGEICLRGPHVMLGYYSGLASNKGSSLDKSLTSNAMTSDGYYRTGDEGLFDYRGRLWIIGRTKELIKVRGFQVAPAELDSLFAKHPDLLDAAATGILDDEGGEQVVMYIVPRDSSILSDEGKQQSLTAKLAHFVSDKAANYKWPRYYAYTSTVLKNPTGKIMRKDLHTLQRKKHLAPRQIKAAKI